MRTAGTSDCRKRTGDVRRTCRESRKERERLGPDRGRRRVEKTEDKPEDRDIERETDRDRPEKERIQRESFTSWLLSTEQGTFTSWLLSIPLELEASRGFLREAMRSYH